MAFVALMNSEHNRAGYFVETGADHSGTGLEFPIAKFPPRLLSHGKNTRRSIRVSLDSL
jgi:hypothetical protein